MPSIFAAMVRPAPGAILATSASSKTILPISLASRQQKAHPTAPLTLIGHSSGGGFVLKVAGSPIQNLFARTVLLAPYLGYDAPSTLPNAGGWASADLPRIIALTMLRRLGLPWAESLPTVAFAVPPASAKILNASYSYRLMTNFAASRDFRQDLANASRPIAIFAGAADELMLPGKYQEAVGNRGAGQAVIDGIDHMGIVGDPAAVSIIADDVATSGLAGSRPRSGKTGYMIDSQQAAEARSPISTRSCAASGNRGSTISPA